VTKGRQPFKKEVGGEKIERKGKSVGSRNRNCAHLYSCSREKKKLLPSSKHDTEGIFPWKCCIAECRIFYFDEAHVLI